MTVSLIFSSSKCAVFKLRWQTKYCINQLETKTRYSAYHQDPICQVWLSGLDANCSEPQKVSNSVFHTSPIIKIVWYKLTPGLSTRRPTVRHRAWRSCIHIWAPSCPKRRGKICEAWCRNQTGKTEKTQSGDLKQFPALWENAMMILFKIHFSSRYGIL